MPGFDSKLFKMDWLHCADLGITAKMWGAILHLSITLSMYGQNQQDRLAIVWREILAWYASAGVMHDRLKQLPLKRFKQDKARPCLKASGGQVRALVPFFLQWVHSWPLDRIHPDLHAEIHGVQRATAHLAKCYDCLSSKGPGDQTQELRRQSILYAEELVALAGMNDLRYSLPPKLHMWLELCCEGCVPSQSWNYRDEDFGGSVASMARRRGGKESAQATSMATLKSFMLKQPVPIIRGSAAGAADVGGTSSSSSSSSSS